MLCLCTVIMFHNGTSSSYGSAFILRDLALYLLSTSVTSVFVVLFIFNIFLETFFSLSFGLLSLVGLAVVD